MITHLAIHIPRHVSSDVEVADWYDALSKILHNFLIHLLFRAIERWPFIYKFLKFGLRSCPTYHGVFVDGSASRNK